MPNISKKLVFGKGMKGDGVAGIDGKQTKVYITWVDMLGRCYNQKTLSKHQTYIGCSVCSEWLFFPTFKEWYDKNCVEGWQLDKDLLVSGNKVYSPDTCIFVPQSINNLFTDSGRARGDYPIGVTFHKQHGKFVARLNIDGKLKHLGYFCAADEAHRTYLRAKKTNVLRVADKWKEKISDKLYIALLKKAEDLLEGVKVEMR